MPPARPWEERLIEKVDVPADPDGCWLWTASLDGKGYGQFYKVHGKPLRAHRVVYEFAVGPIPEGLVLDHLCRVRSCVNPDHLEPVTEAENIRRGDAGYNTPKRDTCDRGHRWDEGHAQNRRDGTRYCKTCQNALERARRAKAKESVNV